MPYHMGTTPQIAMLRCYIDGGDRRVCRTFYELETVLLGLHSWSSTVIQTSADLVYDNHKVLHDQAVN